MDLEKPTKLPGKVEIYFRGDVNNRQILDQKTLGAQSVHGKKDNSYKPRKAESILDSKLLLDDSKYNQIGGNKYSYLHQNRLKEMKDKMKDHHVDEVRNTFFNIDLNNLS